MIDVDATKQGCIDGLYRLRDSAIFTGDPEMARAYANAISRVEQIHVSDSAAYKLALERLKEAVADHIANAVPHTYMQQLMAEIEEDHGINHKGDNTNG